LRAKIYQFLGRKGADPIQLRTRLRRLAHLNAGPVREDQAALERALRDVAGMKEEWAELGTQIDTPVYNQEWVECLQLENMLDCLQLVLHASLLRTESRGAAYRRDFPETNNRDWCKNIVSIRASDGTVRSDIRPVVVTSFQPPSDVHAYGQKWQAVSATSGH
jgi:succinate dehydrogenase / fumarate reductase flavoprotein subunit